MGLRKGQTNSGSFKKGMTPYSKGKFGKDSLCWKGGFPNCLDCGKRLTRYGYKRCSSDARKKSMDRAALRILGLKGVTKQQNMKEPTSIEKKVYDFLVLKGIIFEKQKLINGHFLVDAYIPSLNMVIEADGEYWHGLDRVMKKDKAENAYLKKCGFNLLRLSEDEINSGEFKERLVKNIE